MWAVVFKHPDEKTLYVVGDTVWYDAVIIVVNVGINQFLEGGSLVMGKMM